MTIMLPDRWTDVPLALCLHLLASVRGGVGRPAVKTRARSGSNFHLLDASASRARHRGCTGTARPKHDGGINFIHVNRQVSKVWQNSIGGIFSSRFDVANEFRSPKVRRREPM